MKIPEFKPSKRYLRDINLSCLAATIKNSELPTIAARHISEFKSDPKCEIYLRGKEPKKISVWQQEMLELLFEKEGLAVAVVKGMKECNNASTGGYDDLDEAELQQIKERGIEAFVMLSMIAIDEVTQEVLIKAYTIFDCVLDEHGMVFVLRDGRWCFEEGDYLIRVMGTFLEEQELKQRQKLEKAWESVFPPGDPEAVGDDGSALFGVWRYNPDETARVRKLLGASAREVKEAFTSGLSLGRYFSPTTTESLSHGQNILSRDVVRYERRGNSHTINYAAHETPALAAPEKYWCDGKLLVLRFDKDVFTRADDSYRKPARVVSANTELVDLLKQIRKDKSR